MSTTNDIRPAAVLGTLRGSVMAVALFSVAGNLLLLTGPLFMLQVYDRILPSGSIPTLAVLFALVCFLYLFYGLFDVLRTKLFARAAYRVDHALGKPIQRRWISGSPDHNASDRGTIRDLKTIRHFLVSGGPPALFDLPWVTIYLAVIFALHFWLGVLAMIGVLLVITLTAAQELATRRTLQKAGALESRELAYEQQTAENADALISMGMVGNITDHWSTLRNETSAYSQSALSVSQTLGATSKAIRLLIQSGMLALGALLAIQQEISAGTLIAASIVAGRALAPIDQAAANWRGFIRARMAVARIKTMLKEVPDSKVPLSLPKPAGRLKVKGLVKLAPDLPGISGSSNRPLLQGIDFELSPGDGLGIIGPSGSGKSCLARMLVGLWTPERGSVRFDGAPFSAWDRDRLGQHIGYLPQNLQLLPGTVGQNISRFGSDAESIDIVEAAGLADVHETILALPLGYNTPIGGAASPLSGGQAQKIALARALYKTPSLVVLDEPNANLDADGETALSDCIRELRTRGSVVVVIAHRPSAVDAVNKVLILNEGRQVRFGDKRDLLSSYGPASTAKILGVAR